MALAVHLEVNTKSLLKKNVQTTNRLLEVVTQASHAVAVAKAGRI